MRVIAGKVRRMTLVTPQGKDVRPTTDRIKETLFNIIQNDLYDCEFLDLFSGSGGIGIEALSRGAKEAVFVDKSKESLRCIEYNLEHTRLTDEAEVLPMDCLQAIRNLSKRNKHFDIVFMDPPYECDLEAPVLEALDKSGIIDNDTMIIIETSLRTDIEQWNDNHFTIERVKSYKTNQHVFLSYNMEG
ncbi:MAG: 16S rRNA (guanine(966)-N(2))-methyltransferase RsmD [Lachnoclostridium sp.]|jgi:RNA methyltransferase, rsmD family|nr:16S rRNA (guanine(966)-N(2))-methyltransferase RsmD [Lachnoclostridium sp.]